MGDVGMNSTLWDWCVSSISLVRVDNSLYTAEGNRAERIEMICTSWEFVILDTVLIIGHECY